MSEGDQRGRITNNTSLHFWIQNTADGKSFNAWGSSDRAAGHITTGSEILGAADQNEHTASRLPYSEDYPLIETRGGFAIEDEKKLPEETYFTPAGAATDDPETESEQPADNSIVMSQGQNSSTEHHDLPDSFETVDFGKTGPPKYKRQTDTDYFHCGRLIGVPSNHLNEALRGRTLVVLTVSNHGWAQCVCLCRHEGLNGLERKSFYRTHGAIYSKDLSSVRQLERALNDPIKAKMSNMDYKIREDCYINFEHTFTLNKDFMVASFGTVEHDHKQSLVDLYQKVQKSMYERQTKAIADGED